MNAQAAPPEVTPTAPDTEAAPAEGTQALPPELLQIPALQAVLAGTPPAVSASLADFDKRPEGKLITDHKDALLDAGFGFYRDLTGKLGVIFNQFDIHGEDIKAADQAGKLTQVAPPFDVVNAQVSKMGVDHPALQRETPSTFKAAAPPAAPQAASGALPITAAPGGASTPPNVAPAPASVQRKLMQQRIANMKPASPVTGAAPGGGRVLGAIQTPAV